MIAIVPYMVMIMIFACLIGCLDNLVYRVSKRKGVLRDHFPRVLAKIFLFAAIFIYTLSRVFIVVESFISLKNVPIRVYAIPA
jgi:hypothetical protein